MKRAAGGKNGAHWVFGSQPQPQREYLQYDI